MINQERGEALLKLQARECGDNLAHLSLLFVRFQIRTVDIAAGAHGDQHGFRAGAASEGKATVVQHDALPYDVGLRDAETLRVRKPLRGVRNTFASCIACDSVEV